ncbi:oxidoreductase [Sphingomonas sp. Leaf23]|uniref:aldo/keto reductase n=1 Tax=Sphingomonas sp. Leaf23 TaxID=1735689 RepID=UPI0006FAC2C3|nr:aldo/keto reductase [Sphingomonas sp. Leaf23]KQM81807.1 oxidoreductase [Sphingomonas sp. Leaf23]
MDYRTFGRTGLQLSQLALGTGNFGTRWGDGAEPDTARAILDAYADAGGNFIDGADAYQFGESEEILGEALAGRRDDFVLATKFTNGAVPQPGPLAKGNSRRTMTTAVEASLKRLRTDRIDLLWVHWPDDVTPVDEIVRGLDDLARAGKILYAGLSNFPAWRLVRAATIAELTRAVPIAAAQFEHSLVHREAEADLFPATRALGIAATTWSPLGGGVLTGKYRNGETGRAEGFGGRVFQPENSDRRTATIDAVLAIAAELDTSPDRVALAWAMTHGSVPIVGPRTIEQARSNLGALDLRLSADQLERLDHASGGAAVRGTGHAPRPVA